MLKKLIAATFAVAISPAFAANNHVDLRLSGNEIQIEDSDSRVTVEGAGFDLRGHFGLSDSLFARGSVVYTVSDEAEVATNNFGTMSGEVDTEVGVFRGGLGAATPLGSITGYAAAEFLRVTLEADGDEERGNGFVLSAGLKDSGLGKFLWNAELGYASVEGDAGATFDFALGYRFTPSVAATIGGQSYVFSEDGIDTTFGYGNIGLRLQF